MLGKALADVDSMKWFVVAGFLCYFNFMCWYRGNAMCGAALGMACNGAYSFWGPSSAGSSWASSSVWTAGTWCRWPGWRRPDGRGIFTIATNPLALFHRKEQ